MFHLSRRLIPFGGLSLGSFRIPSVQNGRKQQQQQQQTLSHTIIFIIITDVPVFVVVDDVITEQLLYLLKLFSDMYCYNCGYHC